MRRPLLRDRYGRYVAIDAPQHSHSTRKRKYPSKSAHKIKKKKKTHPKSAARARPSKSARAPATATATTTPPVPTEAASQPPAEDQVEAPQPESQPQAQPEPEPQTVVVEEDSDSDSDDDDDDGGSKHAPSNFAPSMAALVAILLSIGVAATNFFLYTKMLAPPLPFYERLGEAGSTIAIALLLTLFVLGATYRIQGAYAILFALLSIIFLLVALLARAGNQAVEFMRGDDVYQVGIIGATSLGILTMLASGNSTGIMLSMPYVAAMVLTTLDYMDIIDIEASTGATPP